MTLSPRGPSPRGAGRRCREAADEGWKFASLKPVRGSVPRNQQFDEIRVFEGVAERTGTTIDGQTVRRSPTACRSVSELTRRVRRLGDGLFYLPVSMWPEGKTEIPLAQTWTTMS